jgi:predicted short-subunit dehydrogenase-like oxidoreductase (DUF2520 family)
MLTENVGDKSDLYIIAVSDSAIAEVAQLVRVDKKLIVHTAGSVEKDILLPCSKNYGVLYPLQSLRKEMDYLPEIPFLVDGNTADNAALIEDLAKSISSYVQSAGDTQRLMSHTAAVIVSNFTNHLYTLAEDFCIKENLDFKMFMPLIHEVAERVQTNSPGSVQTGPAIRNDTSTINKHISLLSQYPLQRSVYRFLTDSIRHWHDGGDSINYE